MNAYLDDDSPILRPESAAMMNAVTKQLSQPGDARRGLGWEAKLTAGGRRYLTHSGGGPGFATIFRVYPEENLGVVIMGNDSTIDRETLADVLANGNWESE
jgi:CubicO group peptidase (beta-lactamase class C family)